jgi:hypothetical protein
MITPISQFSDGILLIEGIVENPQFGADHAIVGNIQRYISIYEPIYIREMFGCEVGNDFNAYIKNRPANEDERVEKWERLINHINGFDVSPIACFVFYWFVRQRQTQPTAVGVTKNNSDNPVVSPNIHLITAWSMMAVLNKYLIDIIDKNREDYPDWDFNCSMLEPINEFGI